MLLYFNFVNFCYFNLDSNEINFEAFTVNSTFSMINQKLYIDIFECKFVPIKFVNRTAKSILISELIDDHKMNKCSTFQVEPMHSVPYWPIDFQIDINKDGCGTLSKCYNRFRFGVEIDNGNLSFEY